MLILLLLLEGQGFFIVLTLNRQYAQIAGRISILLYSCVLA